MKAYILANDNSVMEADLSVAMHWRCTHTERCRVAWHESRALKLEVSTVFLGIDHNLYGAGPPLVFETRATMDHAELMTVRWSTWAEAERGHQEVCEELMQTEDSEERLTESTKRFRNRLKAVVPPLR